MKRLAPSSPSIDKAGAVRLAAERFGLDVTARELPSYVDRNFLLEDDDGSRWVLKLAHHGAQTSHLELENAVMQHLAEAAFPAPRVVTDLDGNGLAKVRLSDGPSHVRLLTWIEGVPLAELRSPALDLFRDLGSFLGGLDRALAGFDHPAARRELRWDLLRTAELRPHLEHQADPERRAQLADILERFGQALLPRLAGLPRSVVHNDANDHNVIVTTDHAARVVGLVDFGDVVHTARVSEVAIALTYAMLQCSDPMAPVAPLLSGYHGRFPLDEEELALLPALVETRLGASVTISAMQRARDPENPYIGVTEPHAWKLLEWFRDQAPDVLATAFRSARQERAEA